MRDRIVGARAVGNADKHRGLGDVDALCVLAEVVLRRALYAVAAVAVVVAVAVEFHDLGLVVFLLDLKREHDLENFPAEGLLLRQDIVLDDLLRDCAAALGDPSSVFDVHQRRTECTDPVDAVVRLEPLVLHVDISLLNIFGNFGDIDVFIIFVSDLAYQISILVVNGRVRGSLERAVVHFRQDIVHLALRFHVERMNLDIEKGAYSDNDGEKGKKDPIASLPSGAALRRILPAPFCLLLREEGVDLGLFVR